MLGHRLWLITIGLVVYATSCLAYRNCRLTYHIHNAVKTDKNGHKCWDKVLVRTCGGYCDTSTATIFDFPYMDFNHTVCVHHHRKSTTVILSNCDPEVKPGTEIYQYLDAVNCTCQICDSSNTECRFIAPNSNLLTVNGIIEQAADYLKRISRGFI